MNAAAVRSMRDVRIQELPTVACCCKTSPIPLLETADYRDDLPKITIKQLVRSQSWIPVSYDHEILLRACTRVLCLRKSKCSFGGRYTMGAFKLHVPQAVSSHCQDDDPKSLEGRDGHPGSYIVLKSR